MELREATLTEIRNVYALLSELGPEAWRQASEGETNVLQRRALAVDVDRATFRLRAILDSIALEDAVR